MNDSTNEQKINIFLKVAGEINSKLNTIPILYGSLGLYRVLGLNKKTGDIDVLIYDEYVQSKWAELLNLMNGLGYVLKDEHEHEFVKDDQEIAFATQSDLLKIGGVDPESLDITKIGNIMFKELTAANYLFFYETIYKDDYRREKKGVADQEKIKLIKNFLSHD